MTSDFGNQWGDDWNDAPYEHNAGTPYLSEGFSVEPSGHPDGFHVFFESDLAQPNEDDSGSEVLNSGWSVERINAGYTPWLRSHRYSRKPDVKIFAGITLLDFVNVIQAAGGAVYERRI